MPYELMLCLQVLLAFFLGFLIGLEREYHHSPAGLRTYAAVCLGACVFGLISTHAQGDAFYKSVADPTRIAAQIVSGIGFLGAGVIFKDNSRTRGLTTAATIWATAAVGLGVAFKMYAVSALTTFLIIFLLMLAHFRWFRRLKSALYKDNNTETDTETETR